MKNYLMFASISVMLIATTFFSAYGQTQNYITVSTDKTSYMDGDNITISGSVLEKLDVPISIVIKDPAQKIVYIGQVNPKQDNTYSTTAVAGGSLWKSSGSYEIDVTYSSKEKTARTVFVFGESATNTNQTGTNQNPQEVIPEFGSASMVVIIIASMIVIASTRLRRVSL